MDSTGGALGELMKTFLMKNDKNKKLRIGNYKEKEKDNKT